MNTRRYPRTLAEAFPHGPDYGCAIERPLHLHDRIVVIACAGAAIALATMAVFGWLS